MGRVALISIAVAVGALATPAAAKPQLSFTTGLTYSEGDYGGEDEFRSYSIPLSARLRTGRFRFSARMPYLFRSGPGVLIDEGGPIIGPVSGERQKRRGFGDLTLGVSYSLPQVMRGVEVDLGTSVKLPTSKERKRLGTGKTDVAFSADIAVPGDRITPFLNLGYRIRGDRDDLPLKNGFSTSVGATVPVGSAFATASYDYSEAASRSSRDAHSLTGSVSRRLSRNLSISGFGSAGLSKGAADLSTGLLLTVRTR